MSNHRRRKTYDKEFKREAIHLVIQEGRKAPEVERNLGIGESIVGRWVREMREDPEQAFPGKGRLKPNDEKIMGLRRELDRVMRARKAKEERLARTKIFTNARMNSRHIKQFCEIASESSSLMEKAIQYRTLDRKMLK